MPKPNETYEEKLVRLIRYYTIAHKMGASHPGAVTTAGETLEILEAVFSDYKLKDGIK